MRKVQRNDCTGQVRARWQNKHLAKVGKRSQIYIVGEEKDVRTDQLAGSISTIRCFSPLFITKISSKQFLRSTGTYNILCGVEKKDVRTD